MATHSSVLAWRIPGMVEPVGLPVYGVAQSRTRLKQVSSREDEINVILDDFATKLNNFFF